MPAHNRKLKNDILTLGGFSFECQANSVQVVNNTEDGEKFFTHCPDGEFREEAEPDYALELNAFSDWRVNGISDYLWAHDQETVAFTYEEHVDIVGEHVRWSGNVKIKAPSVGGEARTTERSELTMPIIGKPTYARI